MNTRLECLPPYTGSRVVPIGSTSDGQSYSIVAEVPMGGGVTGETDGEKLARLFCASPDLLAALQACVDRMAELQKVTNYPLAWPRVQAAEAIARATGKA